MSARDWLRGALHRRRWSTADVISRAIIGAVLFVVGVAWPFHRQPWARPLYFAAAGLEFFTVWYARRRVLAQRHFESQVAHVLAGGYGPPEAVREALRRMASQPHQETALRKDREP